MLSTTLAHARSAREQHIRREKATSNICTSQALLANMAAMYAVYHGSEGLLRIANKVHGMTQVLRTTVEGMGYEVLNANFFDTLTIKVPKASAIHDAAANLGVNFRRVDDTTVGVTLDESVSPADLVDIINAFSIVATNKTISLTSLFKSAPANSAIPPSLARTSKFLQHSVFNTHHSETEMLRYIHHLQSKDLSLVHSMIPLGSCTMKLNSTSSMIPVTWPEFSAVHPFVPVEQVQGYQRIIKASLTTSI